MKQDVVLIGPPGAGKGTQAKELARRLGARHVSTGDILRGAISRQTPLGLEVKQIMAAGQLVPDAIVDTLVADELDAQPEMGVVFDGYPRTTAQAGALAASLAARGRSVKAALLLVVDDARLIGRLGGRRSCSECQALYHVTERPPRQAGRCDACGGTLRTRPDDTETVIKERLSVYHAQTAPLITWYGDRELLRKVDGDSAIEVVTERVLKALGV